MKTITEYQPLLFSTLAQRAAERDRRRERLLRNVRYALPVIYGTIGMKVTADTGLVPWDLGFWIIMAPLIALSEYALSNLRRA